MDKCRFYFWNISFFFMLFVLYPYMALGSTTVLEDIKLKELPQNWSFISEFAVPQEKIELFESRFVAAIDGIYNQLIMVDDGTHGKLQVNYVLCHTELDAILILRQMVEMVGQRNIILRDGNVVIEIIATNRQLQREVVTMVNVSNLQQRKLTNNSLPDNWKFVREISMNQDEVKSFSQKMMVNVDEVINQFFLIDRERVQLNYIGCKSGQDAEQVYTRLSDLTGKVNTILKKDSIVIEVISTTPKGRDEVVKRFEQF